MILDKKITIDVSYDIKIDDILFLSSYVTIDQAMMVIEKYAVSFVNSPHISEIKREELIAKFKSYIKKLQNGR